MRTGCNLDNALRVIKNNTSQTTAQTYNASHDRVVLYSILLSIYHIDCDLSTGFKLAVVKEQTLETVPWYTFQVKLSYLWFNILRERQRTKDMSEKYFLHSPTNCVPTSDTLHPRPKLLHCGLLMYIHLGSSVQTTTILCSVCTNIM